MIKCVCVCVSVCVLGRYFSDCMSRRVLTIGGLDCPPRQSRATSISNTLSLSLSLTWRWVRSVTGSHWSSPATVGLTVTQSPPGMISVTAVSVWHTWTSLTDSDWFIVSDIKKNVATDWFSFYWIEAAGPAMSLCQSSHWCCNICHWSLY